MKVLFFFACLLVAASSSPSPRNALTCEICVDIVTDFDNWLTSDKTEAEIVDYIKQLCHTLGQLIAGFEATCNFLIESQLPGIIDDLVNSNLDPLTVCTSGALAGSCP